MSSYEKLVTDEFLGIRGDLAISIMFPDLSRTRIQKLILSGCVSENGRTIYSVKEPLQPSSLIKIFIKESVISALEPENIPLNIVFEDEFLLVINKPAGLVVHPAPGNYTGTLVHGLLHYCGDSLKGISGVKYPGIVHRLDQYTSGLMVVAKEERTHQLLSEQIKQHLIKRVYHAICWGKFKETEGSVCEKITRSPYERKKMAILHYGKEAKTNYKVLETYGDKISLVECALETGRTHQIRLHLCHIGNSIVGDPLYGRGRKNIDDFLLDGYKWPLSRQALHSISMSFQHPQTQKTLSFSSDYPDDFQNLLKALKK